MCRRVGSFTLRRHVPSGRAEALFETLKHRHVLEDSGARPSALRASNSIASKLDDFWLQMRLADLDVPASQLADLGKSLPEAFTSCAPNLSPML